MKRPLILLSILITALALFAGLEWRRQAPYRYLVGQGIDLQEWQGPLSGLRFMNERWFLAAPHGARFWRPPLDLERIAASLSACRSLEFVYVEARLGSPGLPMLQAVGRIHHLRKVCVLGSLSDEETIYLLGDHVEAVSLHASAVSQPLLAHLSRMPALREISLSSCTCPPEHLSLLAASRSLRLLQLENLHHSGPPLDPAALKKAFPFRVEVIPWSI